MTRKLTKGLNVLFISFLCAGISGCMSMMFPTPQEMAGWPQLAVFPTIDGRQPMAPEETLDLRRFRISDSDKGEMSEFWPVTRVFVENGMQAGFKVRLKYLKGMPATLVSAEDLQADTLSKEAINKISTNRYVFFLVVNDFYIDRTGFPGKRLVRAAVTEYLYDTVKQEVVWKNSASKSGPVGRTGISRSSNYYGYLHNYSGHMQSVTLTALEGFPSELLHPGSARTRVRLF